MEISGIEPLTSCLKQALSQLSFSPYINILFLNVHVPYIKLNNVPFRDISRRSTLEF